MIFPCESAFAVKIQPMSRKNASFGGNTWKRASFYRPLMLPPKTVSSVPINAVVSSPTPEAGFRQPLSPLPMGNPPNYTVSSNDHLVSTSIVQSTQCHVNAASVWIYLFLACDAGCDALTRRLLHTTPSTFLCQSPLNAVVQPLSPRCKSNFISNFRHNFTQISIENRLK